MQEKPWIIILTHGRAGEELMRSAKMIMGELKNVKAFSLMPGMSPEDFIAKVKEKLETLPEGVLVLTDLFGGTPFNGALALSRTFDLHIVSGLNIAMLIEADMLRNHLAGRELAESVRKIGVEACRVAGSSTMKNME
ncbi:PTS sugar transporter subunit IIA [Bacillaceae bacterium Marseille-Q3522]|nr:PTS sugar transporter subunit IIA [Bacillaceae bacterium Marseille-Q3522]